MDYPYFTATAPQQYPFYPPTPAHSGSTHSDDFSNSPVRGVPLHLASPMSSYHSHFSTHRRSSPSSPQAPVYQPQRYHSHHFLTQKQDAFDQFQQNFDYSQFQDPNANGIPPQAKPPTPQPQHQSSVSSNGNGNGNHGYDMNMEMNDEGTRRGSNSDDDDNMTPAQSRRKAQNRAAQRAFRERKERHVKDLEAKLAAMEKNSASVAEENERLKLQLQKAATENEILKATSSHSSRGSSESVRNAGPMHYSPIDFYTEVLEAHKDKRPSHRIVTSESGERLLAAGAAWDYIINHPLYARGLVDVGNVSDRLKTVAKCDGQGPVFEERAIIDAIENSVASGNDELL
ncbi:Fluconazole resistance 3 [Hyphodiscus hymeniophilus]|uniref:Fluconazole resistance 3 n=1 Tax=Hyphodiscus hymeniophilus TaxID=353542 RepID=A0A9P6VLB0_9HELO|nr:Fluconazole resistance 3 [Hyphodiscus hymeniophilus]